MVQKSANRFVLGTRRTGTRSPERRQYGLSIDTQGINGLSTGDERQSRLIKFMQASSLLWERGVMLDWIRATSWWQFGKTIRRALFCTDSIASSKYFGRAAQTGQAYYSTDLTMLQYTCTSCVIVTPLFLRDRKLFWSKFWVISVF